MKYLLLENDGGSNVTVYHDGELLAATSDNPNWNLILAGLRAGDESVVNYFDLGRTVVANFEKIGERVSVRGDKLYLDGDEMSGTLSNRVLAFLKEGLSDYRPLVKFQENLLANPNDHSRQQSYDWLERHDFALDDDGNVVAYKSVYSTDEEGVYRSTRAGLAIVNGVEVNDYVKQSVGSIVEMPRSVVQHDPGVACHTGLHVGNWSYAYTFSGDVVLLVKVNPRDIVSVPTDCDSQKIRVCRYEVVGVASQELESAKYAYDNDDDSWDSDDSWYNDDNEYDDIYDDEAAVIVTTPNYTLSSTGTATFTNVTLGTGTQTRPTAQNYLKQKRGPDGKFLPKHRI